MPWYKLPHADMVMWFDQDMDLEPAPFSGGGVVKGPTPELGYLTGVIDEVVVPNAPEPEEEAT